MRRLIKIAVGLAVLGGLAFGGTALATGGGGGSETGPDADQARSAALAHLGGGTVNSLERESENGAAWEVEVTKTGGTTVDVRLGADYKVIAVEGDSEESGEPSSAQDEKDDNAAGEQPDAEEPGDEAEVSGDDGPNGHADEPGDEDAGHEHEGDE